MKYSLSIDDIKDAIYSVRKAGYNPSYLMYPERDSWYGDYMEELKFKNGDNCPKNCFTIKDYFCIWVPCYKKLKPEDCKSFKEFKDKLMVAKL